MIKSSVMETNMNNNKGFTLIEMMVAMGLFVLVIMITGRSFETILGQTSKLLRSEESNIEGMLGLEMLRHDLQQAGVGLFTEAPPITYNEAASSPASTYNDNVGTIHVPRPIIVDNNLSTTVAADKTPASSILAGTDYLVIKGSTVARSQTSQKWSYMVSAGGTAAPTTWPSSAENYKSGEYFVLLRKTFSNPPRTFIERNASDNSLWFRINSPAFNAYTSANSSVYLTYGIDDDDFRFPFNRADYFVARTNSGANMPPVCAPNTGVLYKGSINQSNGKTTYLPLLDCVADMQVVLGWDMNLDGVVDTWSSASGLQVNPNPHAVDVVAVMSNTNNDINDQSTLNIRNCLKIVKVYLIIQDGKKDRNYTSPSAIQIGDTGEGSLLKDGTASPAVYTLSSDMLNYRWKEYRIIVRPKNLLSNQ